MSINGPSPRSGIRSRPTIVLSLLLWGLCSFASSALAQAWDPAGFEDMMQAATQARERGDREEAERLCVDAFRHVDASVIKALSDYAALLRTLRRPEADVAQAKADRFRDAKTRPQAGSVYLGFSPTDELKAYAGLLRETGRAADAEAIAALAAAYERTNRAQFVRAMEQQQGRDPRGTC